MAKQFNLKRIMEPVKDIVRKLKDRRSYLMEEVDEIERHLKAMGDRAGNGRRAKRDDDATEASNGIHKRKRSRRSREELVTIAGEIVELIRSKGKEGATAKEIKVKFGNLLPSVNAWLKNYSAVKVKTTGAKSKMRYFA
jgi:hypothetical protein